MTLRAIMGIQWTQSHHRTILSNICRSYIKMDNFIDFSGLFDSICRASTTGSTINYYGNLWYLQSLDLQFEWNHQTQSTPPTVINTPCLRGRPARATKFCLVHSPHSIIIKMKFKVMLWCVVTSAQRMRWPMLTSWKFNRTELKWVLATAHRSWVSN